MINNIVFSGFSILENVLGDFNKQFLKEAIKSVINEIKINNDSVESSLLNKYNFKEKDIKKLIENINYKNVIRTEDMIDKFISFKPIIYRFSNTNTYNINNILLQKLLSIMKLDRVYGIVLKYKDKNDFVNITHPLVLINLLYSNIDIIDMFEYALIYPIDTNDTLISKELKSFNQEVYENYKKQIIEFIDRYITKVIIDRKENKGKEQEDNKYVILTLLQNNELLYYNEQDRNDIEMNKKHQFIVPCHLICENHFIPQYVWIYLKLDNNMLSGRELFSDRILCTNISHNFEEINDKLQYVCNGSGNIYSSNGILNMTKQNVSSQFSSLGFREGFLMFAKANKDASVYILERFLNNKEQ